VELLLTTQVLLDYVLKQMMKMMLMMYICSCKKTACHSYC